MMKLLYLCVSVLYFQICIAQNAYKLDVPRYFDVIGLDPPGLKVFWEPVSSKYVNPVLGYKIRIATINTNIDRRYDLINGEQYPGFVVDTTPDIAFNVNATLATNVTEVIVPGDNLEEYVVRTGIEYNVLYEVRMFAFKRDEEGPMTKPIRVMVAKGNGYGAIVQRKETGCLVSLPSTLSVNSLALIQIEYPFLRNSYI